jgi:hypothetical protein
MSRQRWESIAPFILIAASMAACFWPLVSHPGDLLVGPQRGGQNDLTAYFVAHLDFTRQSLSEFGQWPMWNPFAGTGSPHVGNPQSGLFYPANWIFLLLPAASCASWIMAAHHLLGGIGTFLLARRHELARLPAALAAAVYLAGPYFMAHAAEGHYGNSCAIGWIPWAFLAYERLKTGRPGGAALLGCVLALCLLAGRAQETYYLGLILGMFLLADLVALWRTNRKTEVRRFGLGFFLAMTAAVGLAAVDVLPVMKFTGQAVRAGGMSADEAGQIGIGLANLSQLLGGDSLGGPQSYQGPGRFYWETVCYFGVVPLILALVGVAGRFNRPATIRMALLGLAALLFAFGAHAPLFKLMHAAIPGMSLFRAPARALTFCTLAVSLLAGTGLDWLLAVSTERSRVLGRFSPALIPVAAGSLLVAVALAASLAGPAVAPAQLADSPVQLASARAPAQPSDSPAAGPADLFASPQTWLVLGLPLALAAFAVWRPRFASWAAMAIAAVCVVELAAFSQSVLRTVPPSGIRTENLVFEVVSEADSSDRLWAGQAVIGDGEAWSRHRPKLQMYEPVPLVRQVVVQSALFGGDPLSGLFGFEALDLRKADPEVMDLLGARWAVLRMNNAPAAVADWPRRARGPIVQPVTLRGQSPQQASFSVYENPDPLPRAFVLGQARELVPGEDLREALRGLDPRAEVLVDRDLLSAGPRQAFKAARIAQFTPNRVVIEAELEQPGYLVLTDAYAAGWTATAGGKNLPLIPADVGFRGVPLEAGRHEVVFEFEPPGLRLGAWLTFMTLLTAGALTWKERTARPAEAA